MSSSPIFIAGPSRSGTTLTSKILGRHSQIFVVPGPLEFLYDLPPPRADGGSPHAEAMARDVVLDHVRTFYSRNSGASEQASVEDLIRHTGVAAELLSASSESEKLSVFLDARTMRAGKSRWARHAPGSLYDLPKLISLFPDARFIFCVRDPLDYLVSYRDSYKRAERQNRFHEVERLRKLYHPVVTSLLWVANMRVARRGLENYRDRVLLSRYEDLVADPERSIQRICAFIGSSFEPTMLDINTNNSSETVTERGIYSSSVGRWRMSLTETDAFIAQKICRGTMRSVGYSETPLRPNPVDVAWRILTTPAFALRALAADPKWRKSKIPYVTKRIAMLVRR